MKKLILVFTCALFTQVNAQTWNQNQKLVSTHRVTQNKFGETVAISNQYAAIGSPFETTDADNANVLDQAGAVYISKQGVDSSWTITQKITPSDRADYDNFGASLCFAGDFLIVGAPYNKLDGNGANPLNNAGAAYIYKASGDNFTLVQKISSNDRAVGDNFGFSVAMHGNYIVVGAIGQDLNETGGSNVANAGAAYIFEYDGSSYVQVKKLVGLYRSGNDSFGRKVAIHGNNILIGTRNDAKDLGGGDLKTFAGAAYIFNRGTNNQWTLKQRLVASDRTASDYFGESVAIEDSVAVIGASGTSNGTSGQAAVSAAGSAYLFKINGMGEWVEFQKIVSNERHENAYFGHSAALNNGRIVIGSRYDKFDSNNQNSLTAAGAAYIFKKTTDTQWDLLSKITASDRKQEDAFGTSVAISHDNIIIGAPEHDFDIAGANNIAEAGASYIFNYACATVNPTLTSDGITISASITGDSYQWVDCADNYAPITGATNATYNPVSQGNYALEVTIGTCNYTSNCLTFYHLGIEDATLAEKTEVYPNPSDGNIFIHSPVQANIKLTSLSGAIIQLFTVEAGIEELQLNQATGIYLLHFTTEQGSFTKRISIQH